MKLLSVSVTLTICQTFSFPKPKTPQIHQLPLNIRITIPNRKIHSNLSSSSSTCNWFITKVAATTDPSFNPSQNRHWRVHVDAPPHGVNSKQQIIDYYVKTLQKVIGSEKDAQMCIYDASLKAPFSFCCDIDEEIASQLGSLPGVVLVRYDPDFTRLERDFSCSISKLSKLETTNMLSPAGNSKPMDKPGVKVVEPDSGFESLRRDSSRSVGQLSRLQTTNKLFPAGNSKHWLVRMDKPGVEVITKAQIVDYYVQILTKVMRNEKDAQMCIYHVSWKTKFGFCCELDKDCAQELAGLPGVLSVQPDNKFESENKDYEGSNLENSWSVSNSSEASQEAPLQTKKLFITGLSFYTSEKTLRAAFEGFGELVEVKVIMDKISKRSKGYAFVEYTTEEAASAALKEMNGKIINGWMIVVDVAKPTSPRYSRNHTRQLSR